MKVKIYHNNRCKKSRAGLEYLKTKQIDFEVVEYLKASLSFEDFKCIFKKLNIPVSELVRTQEEIYKKNYKGKNFSDDEWIQIISDNPKLLQRPVVVAGEKAVLAQPPQKIDEIL